MTTVDELRRELSSWRPGGPPAATWLLPELRKVLSAQFVGTYRPAATNAGWSLDFMHGNGENAARNVEIFRRFVAALPQTETFLAMSNPHLVQTEQRNKVVSIADIARLQELPNPTQTFSQLFRALGIVGHDQLRVLICDGPRQLAWVGATREEPFTGRQVVLLRRLVKPLQKRLRLERYLSAPGLLAATLDAALDALPTAAFVLGPGLTIEIANRMGLSRIQHDRRATQKAIRDSVQQPSPASTFSITRITAAGWPAYLLAIHKERHAEHILCAKEVWGLSVRQARVLELLTTGISNKEIATTLACAEVTVENHVSELFRRSGARSRAGLVGRLFGVP